MKINRHGENKTIISNPYGTHKFFAWPSVVRLQNGKIAVGASGFRLSHVCPFGKSVLSFSEDNGETYTAPAPIIDTPLDDRDAGLCTFGESGLIITSFNNTRPAQRLVMNNCSTYDYRDAYLGMITDEIEEKYFGATFRISYDCGVTFGELHMSPITSPHGPIELKNGKILWVGHPQTDSAHPIEDKRIRAYELNLDGSMEYLGVIDDVYVDGKKRVPYEPHTVELESGRLLCIFRIEPHMTMFSTYSDDGGKTWSEPVRLLDDNGGAPPHILKHSSGALVCLYGRRSAPIGIRAMFSYDDGETWDKDHVVCPLEGSPDIGYPASIELENGEILTVFYAPCKENGAAVIMQQKWSFEKD